MKFLLLLLFTTSTIVEAQIQRNTGQLTGGIYSGALIETFSEYVPSNVNEESYADIKWNLGSIDLFGGTEFELMNIPLRYNIINKQVEVKLDKDVRVAKAVIIERFKWLDINGEYIEFINGDLVNQSRNEMYKVIYEGVKYIAFIGYNYERLAADYNPQFDIGSKTERIVLKENYYFFDAQNKTVQEFNLRTKSFLKLFDFDSNSIKIIKSRKVRNINDVAYILRKLDK